MRLTAILVVLLAARAAEAYPQFQLSQSERCSSCHLSPGGGGLLTDYGRSEAGETLSGGGDGRFLYGIWEPPSWIRLGVDLRTAAALKYQQQARELLVFPMQADTYVRLGGESFSFNATIGLRGGARDPQPPLLERLASREHYVMYERPSGTYARVGRFFPVFGIRSQDHTASVRRYLGFSTLEEPYGVAVGAVRTSWEAHVSAFVGRPIEPIGSGVKAKGAVAYVERRFLDDTAAIAGQARIAVSPDDARVTVGVVGKRWFSAAEVMLLGELDLQRQSFAAPGGTTRYQLAAYGGASKFVARGWLVGAAVHRWQPDVRLPSARDALEINVQYLPRAHLELHLLSRIGGSGDFDDPALLTLLQLHYYL